MIPHWVLEMSTVYKHSIRISKSSVLQHKCYIIEQNEKMAYIILLLSVLFNVEMELQRILYYRYYDPTEIFKDYKVYGKEVLKQATLPFACLLNPALYLLRV